MGLACLLSGSPERVGHVHGHDATTKCSRLAVAGNLNAGELVQIDLDAAFHRAQRGDRAVRAGIRQEGQFLLVCELHLKMDWFSAWFKGDADSSPSLTAA